MRLYKGMKKRLWKKLCHEHGGFWFSRHHKIRYRNYAIPKVGDILHDCDGFNHTIVKVDVGRGFIKEKMTCSTSHQSIKYNPRPIVHSHKRVRWFVTFVDFFYKNHDGQLHGFCGCIEPPDLPRPAEEITKWVKSWDIPEGRDIMDEWHFEYLKEMVKRSRNGEPVCNLNGTPIWEK